MDKTIVRLKAKIKKALEEISAFQEACPHPPQNVRYEYGANTGNYDRYESYWTTYYCSRCSKRWTVDGSIRIEGATCVKDGEELEQESR
jgi:hypothetical protein